MAMSAGICRKRVGFEEIFGSSSPPSCSASKRPRWSGLGSDFGSLSEDPLSDLLQMFPDLDPEVPFLLFSTRHVISFHLINFTRKFLCLRKDIRGSWFDLMSSIMLWSGV